MKQLFACFCSMLSFATLFSQVLDATANDHLVTQFEALSTQQLKENIYIHTDKDIYEPGEDIWFKAYILQGNQLTLSTTSQILYVELLKLEENTKYTITKEKYNITNGLASGHLFLAEILEDGSYQLIMHTQNTLHSASTTIRAVKEFQIKTSVIPQILLDTEFSKDSYHRDEEIRLKVTAFSRSRAPYVAATIIADLYAGDKKIDRIRTTTNTKGEILLAFPASKSEKATQINIRVKEQKKEVHHTVQIPFKNVSRLQFGMYPEGGNLVAALSNTVAFKAVDLHGHPIDVKGELYEDGEKIQSFRSSHYGMGTFTFSPKIKKNYTVRLTEPALDSIFKLPTMHASGIKLEVDKANEKNVRFVIAKTNDVPEQNVYVRAQSRGIVQWMAIAKLTKNKIHFTLPLEKLPQGIAEVTIFDEHFQPIAERLIYANLNQKLHISLKKAQKKFYRQKEKVTLTFSVKDQYKNPVKANLSLSVYDHLYGNKENDYSMLSHYYLFSELKGHVHNASYYFDEAQKNRAENLDLLLRTQGWRKYVWHASQFHKPITNNIFSEAITGKIYEVHKNGTLQNAASSDVQVILPNNVRTLTSDQFGNLVISPAILEIGRGFQLMFYPLDTKTKVLEILEPFEEIQKLTKAHAIYFPRTDVLKTRKKQSSYDTKFSFSETNYLEEVNLTGYTDRNRNRTDASTFSSGVGDYVCFEYGILNCINHRNGYSPIVGHSYRLNNGQTVIYTGDTSAEKEDHVFSVLKGLYPKKEFYHPIYDTEDEKLFPDNRKTLFWAPNLFSGEDGEIVVSFFTSDVQTTFLGTLEGTNGNSLLGSFFFSFEVN